MRHTNLDGSRTFGSCRVSCSKGNLVYPPVSGALPFGSHGSSVGANSFAVGDLDKDGRVEIVFGDQGPNLERDGKDGKS